MAGTLSGGEQQMLAIGRGMMSNPKLLMLDEPSLGLAPLIVARIFDIMKEINASGLDRRMLGTAPAPAVAAGANDGPSPDASLTPPPHAALDSEPLAEDTAK